ncbi:hypothetical protein QBC33DRAFT_524423 [Phialemonium atrogriseum]|uniref:Uncharacterized protein n=1 Tax=Phialemonium atrogriseum TaxID=1093897 RepID=A0AAJ0CCC4_9PEZI|nr:uncharacterized protein QBC33DRAFT_524423 [Phialemonium atrogriseum]KAK1771681.1 hypothetical protein QBC33DRAFT_524423 [Phialemonium atrogriseum]
MHARHKPGGWFVIYCIHIGTGLGCVAASQQSAKESRGFSHWPAWRRRRQEIGEVRRGNRAGLRCGVCPGDMPPLPRSSVTPCWLQRQASLCTGRGELERGEESQGSDPSAHLRFCLNGCPIYARRVTSLKRKHGRRHR